jgi:hypothetical protein
MAITLPNQQNARLMKTRKIRPFGVPPSSVARFTSGPTLREGDFAIDPAGFIAVAGVESISIFSPLGAVHSLLAAAAVESITIAQV